MELLQVDGKIFKVDQDLTPELRSYVLDRLSVQKALIAPADCASCADTQISKLGTATCGGPYYRSSTHTFSATVSGAQPPYTYWWTIQPPTGSASNFTQSSFAYTFQQVGTYSITLVTKDSCTNPVQDTTTCSIVVIAPCTQPTVTISVV